MAIQAVDSKANLEKLKQYYCENNWQIKWSISKRLFQKKEPI